MRKGALAGPPHPPESRPQSYFSRTAIHRIGGKTVRIQKYPVPREIGICPLRLIAHCFDKDIKTICIGPDCEFWRLDIDEKEKVDNGQCGLINF
jgi:hypothetical protein